ncbi:MAG: glycosyltransferase [Planctomycetes bacterium]|nr:glycosyltransferase [Planctomycetota bacterium]
MAAAVPVLAIDASEWFRAATLAAHVSPRHWRRLPARAEIAIRNAFALLPAGTVATWFVAADLAARAPELLRELVAAGHELALLAVGPEALDLVPVEQRPLLLRRWQHERALLSAASGREVRGFRAGFLVDSGAPWWRAELPALGFAWDATLHRRPSREEVVRLAPSPGVVLPIEAPFDVWRLDADQPQLAGLPRRAFAAHYGRLRGAADELARRVNAGSGTIAAALGLPPPPPAVAMSIPAPEPVAEPAADRPRFAVVVPLKDEAAGLESLFVELDAVRGRLRDVVACEFVCVDDGSTDRTWELLQLQAASRPFVRLVRHPHNRGVAAAIRTGLQATDAALAASIDGDLSYDPLELRAMLAPVLAGHADVVTASPYHPRGSVRNVPGWRLSLSRTLSLAYRMLLRSPIRTWTACFRVYRRSAVADLPLLHEGFLGTAEVLVRVLRRGGTVVEHPCVLEARLFGFSKMKVLRTIRQHLGLLVQVATGRVH